MKKAFLTMMLALGLLLPGSARAGDAELINSLLGLGVRAMQAHLAEDETAEEPAPAAEAAPVQTPALAPVQQPTPAPVALQAPAYAPARPQVAAPNAMAQMLTGTIKQTLDGLIEQYKEQYKDEGRAYAQEMGNIVVSRVVQDPEINATISSLRTLCWAVVGYLTLVTFILLGCLLYLKRENAKLLAEVRRMARSINS